MHIKMEINNVMNPRKLYQIVKNLSVANPRICYGVIFSESSLFNIKSFTYDISELISPIKNIDQPILLGINSNNDIMCINNQSDALLDWMDDNEIIQNNNWHNKLSDIDKYLEHYKENDYIHTPLIIENFHRLPVSDQCAFVSTFRSWHQSSKSNHNNVTLVLAGSWSKVALKQEWTQTKHDASPAPDSRDIITLPQLNLADIADFLNDKYADMPHDLMSTVSSLILEITGGDCELIQLLLEGVSVYTLSHIQEMETVIRELPERSIDIIRRRCKNLTDKQYALLSQLCKSQAIVVKKDDIDAELLIIKGLVNELNLELPAEMAIEFSSNLIGLIMRKTSVFNKGIATAYNETVGLSCTANELAYKLILRIENLLRNVIILTCCDASDSFVAFIEKNKITTPRIIKKVMVTKFIEDGKVVNEETKEKSDTISMDFSKAVINNRHDLELRARMISAPDITSLTSNQLCENIIMHEQLWRDYFKPIFKDRNNDKHDFKLKMEKFKDIRNSVAHNRSISWVWVDDLENIHRWLIEKIGRAAAKNLNNS
jgi:hypothetical protein